MAVPSRDGASSRRVSKPMRAHQRTQLSRDPASGAIIRTRSEVYDSGLSKVDRLAQVLRLLSIRTVPGGPGQSRAARSVPGDQSSTRRSRGAARGRRRALDGRAPSDDPGRRRSVGRSPIAALLSPAPRVRCWQTPQCATAVRHDLS